MNVNFQISPHTLSLRMLLTSDKVQKRIHGKSLLLLFHKSKLTGNLSLHTKTGQLQPTLLVPCPCCICVGSRLTIASAADKAMGQAGWWSKTPGVPDPSRPSATVSACSACLLPTLCHVGKVTHIRLSH